MLPRISTIAVFLLFALFSGVQAGEFYCGQEDIENQGSELRSESQPRVRFVFVQFPQDSIPVPGTLTSEHYAVQDSLDHYFAAHSRGSFTFHADSDLIEPTGASGIAWEADLRAELYRDIESLPSEYQDNTVRFPPGTFPVRGMPLYCVPKSCTKSSWIKGQMVISLLIPTIW